MHPDYPLTYYERALIDVFNTCPSPSVEEATQMMRDRGFDTTVAEVISAITFLDNLQLGDN